MWKGRMSWLSGEEREVCRWRVHVVSAQPWRSTAGAPWDSSGPGTKGRQQARAHLGRELAEVGSSSYSMTPIESALMGQALSKYL